MTLNHKSSHDKNWKSVTEDSFDLSAWAVFTSTVIFAIFVCVRALYFNIYFWWYSGSLVARRDEKLQQQVSRAPISLETLIHLDRSTITAEKLVDLAFCMSVLHYCRYTSGERGVVILIQLQNLWWGPGICCQPSRDRNYMTISLLKISWSSEQTPFIGTVLGKVIYIYWMQK